MVVFVCCLFFFFFFFKQKTAYDVSACLVGSEMVIRDRSKTQLAESLFDLAHSATAFLKNAMSPPCGPVVT